ncbi:MAG: prepilin-type N-terminal cleavage/methylation domain-containing protein [Actinomycetes bacterium]
MRLAAPRANDHGFTMLELIIAMMIMGIILAPLASAFFLAVGTTKTSAQTVKDSADAQLLSSFFADDVASSDTVSRLTGCGGANTVVQFHWVDGAIDRTVAYAWTRDPATEAELNVTPVYRLSRIACTVPGQSTPTVVLRTLSTPPVLRCDNAACPASGSKPSSVTLQADEYGVQAEGQPADPHYVFTVQGSRRVNA